MSPKKQLSRLNIDGEWFVDESGRRVILRGVNLGGDSKVPYPDGGTEVPTDFSDHKEVSFVGRPFPLKDAREHLSRLKVWGFNVLRLLTTWEAVEYAGPGKYDEEYLDYYAEVCRLAGEHGLYVFVDFHQDVWSRMTGGDGAPCWLFEKVGIDYTKIPQADAAVVMQNLYDYDDPRPRQQKNYPQMCWASNYDYPINGIMWTLFFGGRDFAPDLIIDGVNVQDYMQGHYLNCLKEIGKRVKGLPNVLGFDTLNEPHYGWIGNYLNDSVEAEGGEEKQTLGLVWKPIEALYCAGGNPVKLPKMKISILRAGIVVEKMVTANRSGVSIWFEGRKDPFAAAGAWRVKGGGGYEILRNDFFKVVKGRKVDFDNDYLFPFFHRVTDTVREINPKWLIFAEKPEERESHEREFAGDVPDQMVNASHWYDIVTLATKLSLYPVKFDSRRNKLLFGRKGIQRMYEEQLGVLKDASGRVKGKCPTLVGEFGIPYDLNGARAYKKWAKGNRSPKIWRSHVMALDLMYNAMDALFLNSTQWNYTATNSNDLKIGDRWNQEDLSVYSEDQRDNPSDINSGGRAMEGFVRPYPPFTQGTPIESRFDRKKGVYTLKYLADTKIKAPTVIFVPRLQFPKGYGIDVEGAEGYQMTRNKEDQFVAIIAGGDGETTVTIRR